MSRRPVVLSRVGWLSGLLALSACAHGVGPAAPPPVGVPVAGLIRPTRVAYSTADELLPAVSADGRRIAYVSTEAGNLDLVVRELPGGSARPITVAAADDFDPSFSPDGTRVVFASRDTDALGDLYVIGFDGGSLQRLTDARSADRQPVYAPDETTVYFTRAEVPGPEFVAALDLDSEAVRVVSPTPGFDPAPAPSGRYLLYTAPPGVAGRAHPHVVVLRLTDGATRALTLGEVPSGFARFATETASSARVVMVRFPDDDTGDGELDANDRASLWAVDVSLERLFAGAHEDAVGEPWPLSTGANDELFPAVSGGWLYFTESAGSEQNVSRMPVDGMFPAPVDVVAALRAAEDLEDARERWFVYRALAARLPRGHEGRAEADYTIVQIHLDAGAEGLARAAIAELERATRGATPGSRSAELRALGELERLALDRAARLARAAGARERAEVAAEVERALDDFTGPSARVRARVALERAELVVARGQREAGLQAFDRLARDALDVPEVAGRAILRRTELLGVGFDPRALAEAYGEIIERFPRERRLVVAAAARVVEAAAGAEADAVEGVRRLLERATLSPIRRAARLWLAERLQASGALDLAAVELAALATEAEAAGEPAVAARAWRSQALLQEARGEPRAALAVWTKLAERYGAVPGVDAEAREAITRVALSEARRAEAAGRADDALAAYRAVLANDPRQVSALRRVLALGQRLGLSERLLDERRAAVEAEPTDAIYRYAYALALTYREPPDLQEAREQVLQAVSTNPRIAAAQLLLGWVEEMLHERGGYEGLTPAIEAYGRAVRVARDVQDAELESEALLGLGNARWRLADASSDAGNFYAAFRVYMDFLGTGYVFERKETALVYWERLSRAAAWSGQWSVAALSSREAIALAEELGQRRRLAQLWATLALTYTRAGEPGYAELALGEYAAALSADERPARLAIAERNRAMVKLDAVERDGHGDVESALADLAQARTRFPPAVLEATPEVAAVLGRTPASAGPPAAFDPPETGQRLINTVPDATRAPFGFDTVDELDLNLALSSRALRAAAEDAAAAEVEGARLALVDARLQADAQPVLGRVREWLGLSLVQLRRGACVRVDDACRVAARALWDRLSQWADDPNLAKDRPALRVERARTLGVLLELEVMRPRQPTRLEGGTDALLERTEELLVEALAQTSSVAALGAQTSSVTLVTLGPVAMDAAAQHARLLHARGLRSLAAAEEGVGGGELSAVLASLDAALPSLERARHAFAEAARVAALVPTPLGERLRALARHGAAEAVRRGAPPPSLVDLVALTATTTVTDVATDTSSLAAAPTRTSSVVVALDDGAARAARELDAPELGRTFELAAALASGDDDALLVALERLDGVWPERLPGATALVTRALARARAVVAARGDAERLLWLVDRAALWPQAARGARAVTLAADPTDASFLVAAQEALAALTQAERARGTTQVETPREAATRLSDARARAEAGHTRLAEVASGAASIALRARLLAEPADLDDVRAPLAPKQALLVPLEADGEVLALLVSGSTTTEAPLQLARTGLSAREVIESLAPVSAELAAGRAPSADARATAARLGEALGRAHAASLEGVAELVVADTLEGVALPVPLMFPGRAVAQVSSATALAAAGERQTVGLVDVWALGAPALTEAGVLSGDDLRALSAPTVERADSQGPLASRPVSERLAGVPVDVQVLGPTLSTAEAAPERAQVVLEAASGGAVAERRTRLPLARAVLPAQVVVLASVEGSSLRDVELALAVRGVASVVVLPAALPEASRQRLLRAVLASRAEDALAQAVRAAVAAEPADTPGLASVRVLGVPGLAPADRVGLAERRAQELDVRVRTLVKAGRFAEAGPEAAEWGRALELVSPAHTKLPGARALAVVSYERAARYDRAAAAQAEVVDYYEHHAPPDAKAKNLLGARIKLGTLLSQAGDLAASAAVLDQVERELVAAGDQATLATVLASRAGAARRRRDFGEAARAFERAIAAYEASGAFKNAATVPAPALDVLRAMADLSLNSLSDSARARDYYLRALGFAQQPAARASLLLSLARVARRRGELAEAAARAEAAGEAARAGKLRGVALEALIESTNIAWYRGDLAQGRQLCVRSQQEAEAQLAAARTNRLNSTANEELSVIYALSVCGLVEMSSGDFVAAERTLLSAIRRARARGPALESEVAIQYNNLGRVYLEFGKLDRAIEAFQRATAIDERRADRFGVAYDLRNLGAAQAGLGRREEAERTLTRALALSVEVQDDNNRLRTLVELGDLYRAAGRLAEAEARYTEALPVAERTDNLDLGAQVSRSRGLVHRAAGRLEAARADLEAAVDLARRLPGRSGTTEYGPHRFAAFDDLVLLHLEQGRVVEAFAVADEARALAQLAQLDDVRVARAIPRVLAELSTLRTTRSASVAAAARARLEREAPAVAARLAGGDPSGLLVQVPSDAAVVVYRPTDLGLVTFVLAEGTLTATVVPVTASALGTRLRDYRRRLDARADLDTAHAELAAWLLAPVRERLGRARRLAVVAHGGVAVVGFAALPWGEGVVLDTLGVVYAPDPRAAVAALATPAPPLGTRALTALAAPAEGADAPLIFAPHEVRAIREAQPQAALLIGDDATAARLLAAATPPEAVAHYAGHSRVVAADPLGSTLRTAGEPLTLATVLGQRLAASLVVLSACETLAAGEAALSPAAMARRDVSSFARAFVLAGAHAVLATPIRVDDVSAALLMKRYYRAARTESPAEALRTAQRVVRRLDPHPAAWATFQLISSY